ncbi:hypothetical protein BDM02DRAFT_3122619 [Thelephora ganbajun]|uniref:Uncharacterized protein n=1 Tax=Thelephora ganbajun TaxID=370292 RepID=A0ACB6Z2S9_THEGA|nr:hypothetical protein BDM02DRAFT_3122619 [Thelephora ganbajun]
MPASAFSSPAAIPICVEGSKSVKYPNPGKACFACNPAYQHLREWRPDPDNLKRQRTLVLCFDGTGDSFDQDNSNVVQFLAMLMKDDPMKQLVYYQAGIGTYTNNTLKTPIIDGVSKLWDKMFANNLSEHIKEGYTFLMQNYRSGDQICIFGFSRGAFTARALAGMLQKIGLLPPSNSEQLPFAYAMYEREDREGLKLSLQFKRAFSVDVRVKFLGVWDTVESVGLVSKYLPFCDSSNAIAHLRHAMALDERRVKFIPSFCPGGKSKHQKIDSEVYEYEYHSNNLYVEDTDIEEVFFAGAHCDVGGGSVPNGERHSLARIPLRWMIRECFKVNTGIIFDTHMLKHEVGLDIDSILEAPQPLPSATLHLARHKPEGSFLRDIQVATTPALGSPVRRIWDMLSRAVFSQDTRPLEEFASKGESQEELHDALSPIYDQLKEHTGWKVVDWIPWIVGREGAELDGSGDFWIHRLVWNRGKGRVVYRRVMERGIKVHRSVRTRMLARGKEGKNKPYLPKIRCMIDGEARRLTREEWLAEEPSYFEWVD